MKDKKDWMSFDEKLTSNAEMMVIEGICLVNASTNKKPLFKKVELMGMDQLICKN